MKNKLFSFVPLFLVFVLSFLTILPLFHSGFFPMHDDTQVQRVFEMHKSLADGMFPVRWVEDLGYGYGYPLFNFYAPLAYYGGAFFVFLFSDSLLATKIMIGLAMVGSGITMFLLSKSFWGKWGGAVSGVLYLFAPYHAVDLYVRGDIGELWAYMFFPIALLGVWKTYKKPSILSMSIGALGIAGVVLSHNLSAFLFMPFLIVIAFIASIASLQRNNKQSIYFQLGLFVFGILLSLWYALPVLTEINYTNVMSQVGGGADFHNHFVCLSQLWQSQWGFGGSAPGCVDGLSFMIGKIPIIVSVVALLILPFLWKRKEFLFIGIVGFLGFLGSIFFMLPISTPIWNAFHQMAFLQYPWRYLLLSSLFSSFLGGLVVSVLPKEQKMLRSTFILIVLFTTLFLNMKYFTPQRYLLLATDSYTSRYSLTWTTSKISDEYMPQNFVKPTKFSEIPSDFIVATKGIHVQKETLHTKEKTVIFSLTKPQKVLLTLAFFPAWKAFDTNQPVFLAPSSKGTSISLPSGYHRLSLKFVGTFIENLSNAISLTSAIILILAIIWEVRKTYEHKSI